MKRLECVSVPEPDVSVSCATARGKEPILVRRPTDSLDSCCMLVELNKRFVRVKVPDHQLVVVAT